jgi:hypothetical protein
MLKSTKYYGKFIGKYGAVELFLSFEFSRKMYESKLSNKFINMFQEFNIQN